MSCWFVTVVFIPLLPVANYSLSFYFNSAPKHWHLLQKSDMSVTLEMVMEGLVKACNNFEYVVTLLINKFGWRCAVTFDVSYSYQTWIGFHIFLSSLAGMFCSTSHLRSRRWQCCLWGRQFLALWEVTHNPVWSFLTVLLSVPFAAISENMNMCHTGNLFC